MARRKAAESATILPKMRPALNPESREGQLISLAMDRVEERIRNDRASSQELVHFLRLGAEKERLEREKLENENLLLQAKVKALEAQTKNEELYGQVIAAMKRYSGHTDDDDDMDFSNEY